jgi:hypothetical protein
MSSARILYHRSSHQLSGGNGHVQWSSSWKSTPLLLRQPTTSMMRSSMVPLPTSLATIIRPMIAATSLTVSPLLMYRSPLLLHSSLGHNRRPFSSSSSTVQTPSASSTSPSVLHHMQQAAASATAVAASATPGVDKVKAKKHVEEMEEMKEVKHEPLNRGAPSRLNSHGNEWQHWNDVVRDFEYQVGQLRHQWIDKEFWYLPGNHHTVKLAFFPAQIRRQWRRFAR